MEPGLPRQLVVQQHGPGSFEWRVEAPAFTRRSVAHDALVGLGLAALPAALLGVAWRRALLLGLALAAALGLARALLAVQAESLTYIRLLGVRLASRRRCGLWSTSKFVPLRRLQGVIVHEEVTAASVHFWLGLSLLPTANGGTAADANGHAAGGSGSALRPRRSSSFAQLAGGGLEQLKGGSRRLVADGGEVEVAFPALRPPLSLLRQVYQQLSPLLQNDLAGQQGEAAPGAGEPAPADGKAEAGTGK